MVSCRAMATARMTQRLGNHENPYGELCWAFNNRIVGRQRCCSVQCLHLQLIVPRWTPSTMAQFSTEQDKRPIANMVNNFHDVTHHPWLCVCPGLGSTAVLSDPRADSTTANDCSWPSPHHLKPEALFVGPHRTRPYGLLPECLSADPACTLDAGPIYRS